MKRLLSLLLPLMLCGVANGANVKISDLPIITSPSTNTLIEVADMNEATKSRSYLLTNLATVADMLVASNAVKAASQATNSTLTQWASIPTNSFVLKTGDTMTGDLTTTGLILTNDAISDIPMKINMLTASTNAAIDVSLNGTRQFALYPGANIAEMRNGTSPQTLRIDNTWSNNGTDYERLDIKANSTSFDIFSNVGGTGTVRPLRFGVSSTTQWQISTAGHLLTVADSSYDIGASGATRPRNVYVSTSTTVPTANVTSSIQNGVTKVLTDATATSALWLAVANTNAVGGEVVYTVSATDGTDTQEITGNVKFGAVGKATAVTAQVADVQSTSAVSAGTLTCTVAANVATNNVLALTWNADTSLTTTNLVLKWRLNTPNVYTVNAL